MSQTFENLLIQAAASIFVRFYPDAKTGLDCSQICVLTFGFTALGEIDRLRIIIPSYSQKYDDAAQFAVLNAANVRNLFDEVGASSHWIVAVLPMFCVIKQFEPDLSLERLEEEIVVFMKEMELKKNQTFGQLLQYERTTNMYSDYRKRKQSEA